MGRPLQPKCRQCRRAGEKLFLKGEKCLTVKCPIVKRNFPPGIHGAQGQRRRISEYGIQLREKQKAKAMYRLGERQFLNYYKEAVRAEANTGEELLSLLERRLDNVIFRLGFASSRDQARQLVAHGHVQVNDRRLDSPSYLTKPGDAIGLRDRSKALDIVTTAAARRKEELPDWLALDKKDSAATVVGAPEGQDQAVTIDAKLIVEYYSR